MQLFILAEEPKAKDEGEFVMIEAKKEEDLIDCNMLSSGEGEPKLILQVMRGVDESHTLKIRGSVDGHQVLALIESEANHNFISVDNANKLAMNKDGRDSFWVCLGDGSKRQTIGMCKVVNLNLEVVNLLVDSHIFSLRRVDVIFRASWLKTLGNINFN